MAGEHFPIAYMYRCIPGHAQPPGSWAGRLDTTHAYRRIGSWYTTDVQQQQLLLIILAAVYGTARSTHCDQMFVGRPNPGLSPTIVPNISSSPSGFEPLILCPLPALCCAMPGTGGRADGLPLLCLLERFGVRHGLNNKITTIIIQQQQSHS